MALNLKKLSLFNFRNYQKKEHKFSRLTTIFLGPNTVGKTNLIEAIYFLSCGKGFHAQSDWEAISWGEAIANIKCLIFNEIDLEIKLTTGEVNGIKTPLKKYLVNGVSRRQIDFVGNLKCVLFKPEDLELITDSPTGRREYLDSVLIQVDREYRRSLLAYQKGLRQRNRLLYLIRQEQAKPLQLYFWDRLLIKNGNLITDKRREFIDFLNNHVDIFADLEIQYDYSAISEERLAKYKAEEIMAGVTLVGPHRDDLIIFQKKNNSLRNVRSFGSRGEQRLAVLSLKLCELDYIEEKTSIRPILLLDDIFSELDIKHRNLVLKALSKQQTIMTTTDINFIEDFPTEIEIIKI